MIVTANPARGETEVEIEGEKYILRNTFGGAAKLQRAIGVVGWIPMMQHVVAHDARAILHGVLCLAIHGDTEKLLDMPATWANVSAVQKAIQDALTFGAEEPDAKNVDGAEETSQPATSLRAAT